MGGNEMILRFNPHALRRVLALVGALMAAGALVATSGTAPAHAAGGSCGTVEPIVRADGSLGLDPTADNCDLYG
jgi:hypothetical protein